MPVELILSLIVLGVAVGVLSGLLGIGGGGLMVPVLTSLFLAQGFNSDITVHMALGTSMASIVMTSLASMLAHQRNQNIQWSLVLPITPGIIVGAFAATFLVALLNTALLAITFSLFMAYVASQMFFKRHHMADKSLPKPWQLSLVGAGIGGLSSLVSIGGGSLTVPYLSSRGITMKRAIGTSAAIGFPIAIAGSLGYVINGLKFESGQAYTVGFIYLPAVVVVSVCAFIFAPVGAKLAHKLPVAQLKKIFSVLLVLLSIRMLLSVF